MAEKLTPTEWSKWEPGLNNDDLSLGDVYSTLPTYEFSSYPLIVLALENPRSPVALKGKCTLLTHDLIHVLLGRGLYVQDEAFVIGYTMGTSKTIGLVHKSIFKFAAHYLYPKKYRFTEVDLRVFDTAFFLGQLNRIEIFNAPLPELMHRKLGELRKIFNIDKELLRLIFHMEAKSFDTRASKRLRASFEKNPKRSAEAA